MDFKKCLLSEFVLTSPEFCSINGRPINPLVQGLDEETYLISWSCQTRHDVEAIIRCGFHKRDKTNKMKERGLI